MNEVSIIAISDFALFCNGSSDDILRSMMFVGILVLGNDMSSLWRERIRFFKSVIFDVNIQYLQKITQLTRRGQSARNYSLG